MTYLFRRPSVGEDLGPPPNFPDDVPLSWCIERQKRVVGVRNWLHWLFVRQIVIDSAKDLKTEIDQGRRQTRFALRVLR